MNNLTLGSDGFTYYETIGGGQGACPDADGPSAIHVAMSNTLNTPVEALERVPAAGRRYEIRRGSGGAGAHRGGDGIVRELEALEPMSYSLITERRATPPPARRRRPGARGAICSTARRSPPRRRGPGPAGRLRSRHRAAAGTAAPGILRQQLFGVLPVAFSKMPDLGWALLASQRPRFTRPAPYILITTSPGTDFKCQSLSRNGP